MSVICLHPWGMPSAIAANSMTPLDLSASVGDAVFVIELIFDRCIISLTGRHSSME